MSLDVYLTEPGTIVAAGTGIFLRKNGAIHEISREEWDERFPNREPSIAPQTESDEVYSRNITHNLGSMANQAGIYECLWRPDEIDITKAAQLVDPLLKGLEKLLRDPMHFKTFNPDNGWGDYEGLVEFVVAYVIACAEHPNADVRASR